MTPDIWTTLIGKFPELASVIVVAIFALQLTREQRVSSATVMATWQAFLQAESEKTRQFLINTNNQQTEVINRLIKEVQAVGVAVGHNTELLQTGLAINARARREDKTIPRKE